ncbi:FkbM family methyltransferase [Paucihalobacter ruber]|nr:FkbM family methyltransferase [Paucihalobacter ruber]
MNPLRIILNSTKLLKMFSSNIKTLIRFKYSRKIINFYYNELSFAEKKRFHSRYKRLYRESEKYGFNGIWKVKFLNNRILIPISKGEMWLNWDMALTLSGHDIEIKLFYHNFIKSDFKPKVFFDVGANYGIHSLIFLSNNIKTVTFEPNVKCKPFFHKMCTLNNFKPCLVNKAVGEISGFASLMFPERETWLGSLEASTKQKIKDYKQSTQIEVEVITLDNYCKLNNIFPDLIKIDTEGFEIFVLKGASHILKEHKPIVIFESNKKEERLPIFDFLTPLGYILFDLLNLKIELNPKSFLENERTNYVAIHSKEKQLLEIRPFTE